MNNPQKKARTKSPSPTQSKDTKTKRIIQNAFTRAEDYLSERYQFRYNEVKCTFEYKEHNTKNFKALNENTIFRELQKSGKQISMTNLIALFKSDFITNYDPLKNYFEKLPAWDGKDHIKYLASFIEAKDKSFSLHLKKHLIRTVACALDADYFNKQAFILVHKKQNSGKSTFCRFLCPPNLKEYIAEDITTDKDSRILLAKNLLINLDELAMLSKKDINSLKALLSKQQINERLPYDRKNTILPRRCSFVGSTNETEFLNDETGTVRWLCFEIENIDWDYSKKVEINKVYAQAYHYYKNTEFDYNLTDRKSVV